MKAREIVETCRGKVDPSVITALSGLAERVSELEQENKELARALDVMARVTLAHTQVQESLADKIKKMRGDPDDTKPISGT